jgi:DNA repair exonuclease SbcCD ATPase subunit
MAAEINELFELAVTHCGDLTDAADAAMEAVDAAAGQAEELTERVEQEGKEAREHLRELVARLQQAEGAIEGARGSAAGALAGLAGKAAGLKAAVEALLERAQRAAEQVEEQRRRLDDSLDAQTATTQAEFDELARETEQVEKEAIRRLEEAGRAVTAFRATIEAARDALVRKKDAWDTALRALEAGASERAGTWVAGLKAILHRQATAMVNAANVMVDRHNDTMDAIKREFAEEAPQEMPAVLEPLQAALGHVGEEAAAHGEALSARVEELHAAMSSQGPDLDGLRADLDTAAELG